MKSVSFESFSALLVSWFDCMALLNPKDVFCMLSASGDTCPSCLLQLQTAILLKSQATKKRLSIEKQ